MTAEELIDFEREIADLFNAGHIRAPVHLAGGNEEQLIEIFEDIKPNDWIFGQWRFHYHCLLKGVPPERLMADIIAGKSMTLNYPGHRIVASAIAGGHLPIAVGTALAIKRSGRDEGVWAFCGDMTATMGIFHECATYAFLQKLPIRFVVENNHKSVCTSTYGDAWGFGVLGFRPLDNIKWYNYELPWPHSGAGRRIEF